MEEVAVNRSSPPSSSSLLCNTIVLMDKMKAWKHGSLFSLSESAGTWGDAGKLGSSNKTKNIAFCFFFYPHNKSEWLTCCWPTVVITLFVCAFSFTLFFCDSLLQAFVFIVSHCNPKPFLCLQSLGKHFFWHADLKGDICCPFSSNWKQFPDVVWKCWKQFVFLLRKMSHSFRWMEDQDLIVLHPVTSVLCGDSFWIPDMSIVVTNINEHKT